MHVTARSGAVTRCLTPRTVLFPCPLQHLQAPAERGSCTRILTVRAFIRPQPLQHLQVPASCGECATVQLRARKDLNSRATVCPRPLQHRQVPARSGGYAHVISSQSQCCFRPRCNASRCPASAAAAHVTSQPRQPRFSAHPRTSSSGAFTSRLIPRTAVLPRPLQHRQVPAPRCKSASPCSHGQPCCRAHCNTSRCPPSAAGAACLAVPHTAVLPRLSQHLQVSNPGGRRAS